MKLYKGFNKDMTCRGYQFEEGKTYTHDGDVELCKSGFHACENPLDCFAYYNPADSIFREVEMEEVSPERKGDSKAAGKTIKIGARISFGKMVQIAVDYINICIDKSKQQQVMEGNYSAASNTNDYSAASNTCFRSSASNTGDYSAASTTGNYSAASNTGDYSAASNTGNCSAAEVSGRQSVAFSMGKDSKARGAKGCWIVCAEWDENKIKDVQCACVDGETIKADVWYTLSEGKFVEV